MGPNSSAVFRSQIYESDHRNGVKKQSNVLIGGGSIVGDGVEQNGDYGDYDDGRSTSTNRILMNRKGIGSIQQQSTIEQ